MAIGDQFYFNEITGSAGGVQVPFGQPAIVLQLLYGNNPGPDPVWLWLFVGGGAEPTPRSKLAVPAGAAYSFAPANGGERFATGCVLQVSTSPTSITPPAFDILINAEGRVIGT